MSTLHFRQFMTSSEQNLLAGLNDEFTQIYGLSVYYIPRMQMNTDNVMPDSKLDKFYNAYPCTVYLKNVESFGGQGNFLNQFGLELRDQVTFTMSRPEFERSILNVDPAFQFTGQTWSDTPVLRPREGDAIYLPMNQKIYQIRFVEHEQPFYPLGKLQAFDLQSELYAPNNELRSEGDAIYLPMNQKIYQIRFVEHEQPFYPLGKLQAFDLQSELYAPNNELYDTGVPEIDAIFAKYLNHPNDPSEPFNPSTDDYSESIVLEANVVTNFNESDPFGEIK